MEVARIISNSAHYTLQLSAELDKLLLLWVLVIIPIVNLIVLGYVARVMRSTPESDFLPPLDRWGEMLIEGAYIFLISVCYLAAGVAITIGLFYIGSLPVSTIGWGVTFLGLTILPLALVHAAKRNDPSQGFAVRYLISKVSAIGWIDYLFWLIATLVLTILILAFVLIPIIGPLLALLLIPAALTFLGRSSALVYSY